MVEAMQLQLDDGTTFEAFVETDETTEDLLRSAGRLRIKTEDTDVEGHVANARLDVIIYGPDDVEGHSMTLRLPHPQAARDLQRKLLAAGVVGVIVVGAATTAMVVPGIGTGTGTGGTTVTVAQPGTAPGLKAEQADLAAAAAALRASQPAVGPGLKAEQADLAAAAAALRHNQPTISPGLKAEQADQLVEAVPVPLAPTAPGLKAEQTDLAAVAADLRHNQPAISPGLKAEQADELAASSDTTPAQPGHLRMRPE